jgi:copper chaperone CopZ
MKGITMTTITVNAPDISCGKCVANVERDISALAGVQSVSADAGTKDVVITFDESSLTREQIASAMDDAGYPIAS